MYQLSPLNSPSVLFEGNETALEQQRFRISAGNGTVISFSFSDFVRNPFHTIRQYLPAEFFENLLRSRHFKKGAGIIERYVNSRNCELYYYTFPGADSEKPFLVLIAFGEISPGHYVVQLEGALEWVMLK